MKRLPDWEARLHAVLADAAGKTRWDCCLFAADCVEAVAGVDPAHVWRGLPPDQYEKTIKELGGVETAATKYLGQYPSLLKTGMEDGDVVMVRVGGVAALGVWSVGRAYVLTDHGLREFSRSCVVKYWSIG